MITKRRITGALAALLLVGAVGACSSGGDDDAKAGNGGGGGGGDADQKAQDSALEFAKCMRDHGVNVPDPKPGGGLGLPDPDQMGASAEQFDAANKACKHFLDEGVNKKPTDPATVAKRQDQALKLAKCMRDRGWDFEDPTVDAGGGIGIKTPQEANPGSPKADKFDKDMKACNKAAGMEEPDGGGQLDSGGDTGGNT